MDISDGLLIDLSRLCEESKVGSKIYSDKIPVSSELRKASKKLGLSYQKLALAGGEDYELLFTGSTEAIDRVKKSASCPITIIGEIIADKAGEITLVDKTGKPFNLGRAGWEHFAPK